MTRVLETELETAPENEAALAKLIRDKISQVSNELLDYFWLIQVLHKKRINNSRLSFGDWLNNKWINQNANGLNQLAPSDLLGTVVSRFIARKLEPMSNLSAQSSTPILFNEIISRIDKVLVIWWLASSEWTGIVRWIWWKKNYDIPCRLIRYVPRYKCQRESRRISNISNSIEYRKQKPTRIFSCNRH